MNRLPLLALTPLAAFLVFAPACDGGGGDGDGDGDVECDGADEVLIDGECVVPGDGDGDGDGDGGGQRAAFLSAFQAYFDACYTSSSGFCNQIEPDEASTESFSPQKLAESIFDDPGVTVNAGQMAACIAAIEDAAETCDSSSSTACDGAWSAAKSAGDPCDSWVGCGDTLACHYNDGCSVCVEPAGDGESCDGYLPCEEGLGQHWAYGATTTCVCEPYRTEGQVCTSYDPGTGTSEDWDCTEGFYCDGEASTCAAQKALGEECTGYDECLDYNECDYATPDAPVMTCIEYVAPAVGIPCTVDGGQCGSSAYSGLACVDGACAAATVVALGASCDVEATYDNDATAWCLDGFSSTYCAWDPQTMTGTCTARPGVGQACDFSALPCDSEEAACDFDDVTGGYVCVALPLAGEPCLFTYPSCAVGLTCDYETNPQTPTCVVDDGGEPTCE